MALTTLGLSVKHVEIRSFSILDIIGQFFLQSIIIFFFVQIFKSNYAGFFIWLERLFEIFLPAFLLGALNEYIIVSF